MLCIWPTKPPLSSRRRREGEPVINTESILPEASLIFLDELLNTNSVILNSLLLVLNEKVFRRDCETRSLLALLIMGPSNHLPENEALGTRFDRFLVRVRSNSAAPTAPNLQAEVRQIDLKIISFQATIGRLPTCICSRNYCPTTSCYPATPAATPPRQQ